MGCLSLQILGVQPLQADYHCRPWGCSLCRQTTAVDPGGAALPALESSCYFFASFPASVAVSCLSVLCSLCLCDCIHFKFLYPHSKLSLWGEAINTLVQCAIFNKKPINNFDKITNFIMLGIKWTNPINTIISSRLNAQKKIYREDNVNIDYLVYNIE